MAKADDLLAGMLEELRFGTSCVALRNRKRPQHRLDPRRLAAMTDTDWFDRVAAIRQWSRHGVRAPHKPLLLLYAIGQLVRLGTSRVSFAAAEGPLRDLLLEFGPPGTGGTPNYPFYHLTKDGLWLLETTDGSPSPGDSAADLRRCAVGRFPPDFEEALSDPALCSRIISHLLKEHFPATMHSRLREAVGLSASLNPIWMNRVALYPASDLARS